MEKMPVILELQNGYGIAIRRQISHILGSQDDLPH